MESRMTACMGQYIVPDRVYGLANLVDIAENSLLNALVLDDLAQNTSITTTNDQDLLRVWVGEHGQVGNHLLVCKLVALSALDDIIEHQDISIIGRLEDEDILILALLMVEDLLDLEGHCLARPHLGDLAEPAI